MKTFLIAAFAALSCLCSFESSSLPPTTLNSVPHSGGHFFNSIVMEDAIMMRTDTWNPSETITRIEVFRSVAQPVLDVEGCGLSSCSTDLSALSSGTYSVRVTKDSGGTFSGWIYLE